MKKDSVVSLRREAPKEDSSGAYQARRNEIAIAGVRVFNRLGLQRATLGAVADEMGVDRTSLYYYFSSKEALFDQIVKTVVARNLELTKKICASSISPRRKLRNLICMLMTSYGEHYPILYIYVRENLNQVDQARSAWSQEMRDMNRQTTDAVITIIEQGYADKSFRNVGSARVMAYGVLGVVSWTNRWFRPESSHVSAEEIGEIYAEMVLGGIESPC